MKNFEINGFMVNVYVEEVKSSHLGKKAFAGSAHCPVCHKMFKAGYGMTQMRTPSDIQFTLKTNIGTHLKNIHGKK